MVLTIFTVLSFSITLTLLTVLGFVILASARLMRLQKAEAYAIQHIHTLNAEQLSRQLHILSHPISTMTDTQEMRKTRPYPPPPWMTKKASTGKLIEDKAIANKSISDIKAS